LPYYYRRGGNNKRKQAFENNNTEQFKTNFVDNFFFNENFTGKSKGCFPTFVDGVSKKTVGAK